MQGALINIWRGSASFSGQSRVSTWACRIALNQGASALRGRMVPVTWEPVQVADAASEVGGDVLR